MLCDPVNYGWVDAAGVCCLLLVALPRSLFVIGGWCQSFRVKVWELSAMLGLGLISEERFFLVWLCGVQDPETWWLVLNEPCATCPLFPPIAHWSNLWMWLPLGGCDCDYRNWWQRTVWWSVNTEWREAHVFRADVHFSVWEVCRFVPSASGSRFVPEQTSVTPATASASVCEMKMATSDVTSEEKGVFKNKNSWVTE